MMIWTEAEIWGESENPFLPSDLRESRWIPVCNVCNTLFPMEENLKIPTTCSCEYPSRFLQDDANFYLKILVTICATMDYQTLLKLLSLFSIGIPPNLLSLKSLNRWITILHFSGADKSMHGWFTVVYTMPKLIFDLRHQKFNLYFSYLLNSWGNGEIREREFLREIG